MAHGVLNTEHLQDVAATITPIDVSGGTWNVLSGATIALVLDELSIPKPSEVVRVDGGQQRFPNRRNIKEDYSISFSLKAQQDDYDAGKLEDLLLDYLYFRITIFQGGNSHTWDVVKTNADRTHSENSASMITFTGEQAYA